MSFTTTTTTIYSKRIERVSLCHGVRLSYRFCLLVIHTPTSTKYFQDGVPSFASSVSTPSRICVRLWCLRSRTGVKTLP